MSELKENFQFESYESYHGDAHEVKRQIDNCTLCQGEMVFSHQSDYTTLTLREVARCHHCGAKERKIIHVLM